MSENTTPKPVLVAETPEPGTKKSTDVTLLPTAMNVFTGLKKSNSSAYVGLRAARLLSLVRNPDPGVENTTPRARPGAGWLKKSGGKLSTLVNCAGTASQLISRRPLPTEPGRFGLSVPRAVRNASTAAVISHAPSNTSARERTDPASSCACAARRASASWSGDVTGVV